MSNDERPPADVVARAGEMIVVTRCWSCGAALYKSVRRLRRGHHHVFWSCVTCDVNWSAPGVPGSLAA